MKSSFQMNFLVRVFETILVYVIISTLGVILMAGKMNHHFPPTKYEVSEFIDKTEKMISQSEGTLSSLQKMAEMSESIQPNIQKILDSNAHFNKRLEALEDRVRYLEGELKKTHR